MPGCHAVAGCQRRSDNARDVEPEGGEKRSGMMKMAVQRMSPFAGVTAGWAARAVPWFLPGRVLTTREVVVLHHPRPESPGHMLLLPRNRTPGLDGAPGATASALAAMLRLIPPLARAHFERPASVIAVVNGGARQDVRLLHMHLLADTELAVSLRTAEAYLIPACDDLALTRQPLQPLHLCYRCDRFGPVDIIAEVQSRVAKDRLADGGYSLLARAAQPALLHLMANGEPNGYSSP